MSVFASPKEVMQNFFLNIYIYKKRFTLVNHKIWNYAFKKQQQKTADDLCYLTQNWSCKIWKKKEKKGGECPVMSSRFISRSACVVFEKPNMLIQTNVFQILVLHQWSKPKNRWSTTSVHHNTHGLSLLVFRFCIPNLIWVGSNHF